jgi:hypothetical protein
MERRYMLLKRKKGMTFEEFRAHYEGSHRKLGEKYFGHLFQSYRRDYIQTGTRFNDRGAPVENYYDCLTEIIFKPGGTEEFAKIASDPEIRRILIEDEMRFLDRDVSGSAIADSVESDLS